MRVLFTRHLPFDSWPVGWWMRELGGALTQAGHEVHGLVAAEEPAVDDPFSVSQVVCRRGDAAADLDFGPPGFAGQRASASTFDALSDDQISRYRDAWRQRLDREVDSFNPHVIHTSHLWWDAQLALETGVPYVASAWSAELTACAAHPRWRALVQQAAENASRIFVPNQRLGAAVQATFGIAPDHLIVLPPAIDSTAGHRSASRTPLLDQLGLPRDDRPIVVARAATGADHGLDVLINAAARCQTAAASAATGGAPIVAIATSCEPDPEWTRQAALLGLDRLHLVEIRHDADWPQLWQAADLAVFPQRGPADGLDVLWALAAGTPAIVTAASGLDWLTGCQAARVVSGDDHELLAEAIVEALTDSWKAARGKAAVDFVREQHGMPTAARHVAEAYRCVLSQRFGQLPRD